MEEKMTFEAAMARLEKIVATLERGDTGLETALTLFEEASGLAKDCARQLDEAEQRVLQLIKGPDGAPIEQPFEGGQA